MKLKVEIISANPTMCRKWVERPRYYNEPFPKLMHFHEKADWADKHFKFDQRLASLPTHPLISDRQYKVGDVVEARWQWQEKGYYTEKWEDCSEREYKAINDSYRRIVAIPVQIEAGEDVLKHKYYVLEDHNKNFVVWSKERYEKYIQGCVGVGGGGAYKLIVGFNGDENYLFPTKKAKQ